MDKRAARFSLGNKMNESFDDTKSSGSSKMSLVWNSTLNVSEDRIPESSTEHIIGTCQDIEKQYLRLTSVRIFYLDYTCWKGQFFPMGVQFS